MGGISRAFCKSRFRVWQHIFQAEGNESTGLFPWYIGFTNKNQNKKNLI